MISFAIGGHISHFSPLTSHFSPLTTKAYLLLLASYFLLLNECSLASKRAFSLVQTIDL